MFSRRNFLKSSVSTSLIAAPAVRMFAGETSSPLADYYDCGVASGDPTQDSVIIWTRVPRSAQVNEGEIEVFWEVALAPDFSSKSLVASGVISTQSDWDYTVNIKVTELNPYTYYYYRFRTETGYQSEIGRTKTAPSPDMDIPIRFTTMSCQDFPVGFYTPFIHMAREDLDFCVHLGDFIYEVANKSNKFFPVRRDPVGDAQSLEDYRSKYRLYLSDPFLREIRRLFPFIHVWDDHEVQDDYSGTDTVMKDRMGNGHQAYCEYIPMDIVDRSKKRRIPVTVRNLRFGKRVEIIAMDTRQFRDIMPCKRRFLSKGCDGLLDENLSMLGLAQRAWIKDTLGSSGADCKFVLSSIMFMPFKFMSDSNLINLVKELFTDVARTHKGVYINFDAWDGYPEERYNITQFLNKQNIKNTIICSGDIHSAFSASIYADPENKLSPKVATEITTHSITSRTIGDAVLGLNIEKIGVDDFFYKMNEHMTYTNLMNHGYSRFEVLENHVNVTRIGVETTKKMYSNAFVMKVEKIPIT